MVNFPREIRSSNVKDIDWGIGTSSGGIIGSAIKNHGPPWNPSIGSQPWNLQND